MTENCPNSMKTINPQTQEIQQIPSEINTSIHTHKQQTEAHNKLLNTMLKIIYP